MERLENEIDLNNNNNNNNNINNNNENDENEHEGNYISSDLLNNNYMNDEIITISRYQIYFPKNQNISHSPIERRRKRRKRKINERNERNENDSDNSIYLTIQHKTKTSIEYVGEQLWRGSLILSDYLIFNHQHFNDSIIFELGAGVGFLSIIASLLPFKTIYMTDYNDEIVNLGKLNIDLNHHLLPFFDNNNNNNNNIKNLIKPRVLNWYNNFSRLNIHELNGWSYEDGEILNSNKILWLAADVIYDENITQSFFKTMSNLMNHEEHLLMSIEKRFNFTIEEMSLVAHGYNKFIRYTQGLIVCEVITSNNIIIQKKFHGKRISLLFPQYIEYDRVKDIELWDIQIVFI